MTDLATDGYLTEAEAAALICRKVSTLRSWAARRKGPPRVKFGRLVMYRRKSLLAWLERQERDPEELRRAARGRGGR